MSDLNDFFAKKDRRKKKTTSRSMPQSSVLNETKNSADSPMESNLTSSATAPPPKQPDDGWIEIEDPRGAQVNTGGRTVAEMKRGADDKDTSTVGNDPVEKFSGWVKAGPEDTEDGSEKSDGAAPAPSTAFPSLADTTDAPQVPISRGKKSSSTSSYSSAPNRPRFINTNSDALRKKLAARAAAPPVNK